MNYRVNAGPLPSGHWYHDRRQGGRLLGEVCHFIDTCNAVVGAPVATVFAVGSGTGESLLAEDLVVTLGYQDGSAATISYASGGHPATAKERFEVLGRGHSGLIDDFRRLIIDERQVRKGSQDKGHLAELRHFRRAISSGTRDDTMTVSGLETMRTTLAAAESLLNGRASVLSERVRAPNG